MKLKSLIGIILMFAGQTTYACDEPKIKNIPPATDKKPNVEINGEVLKRLDIDEKINLFKILSKLDAQVDTSSWEDIDIETFEANSLYLDSTIPTVN